MKIPKSGTGKKSARGYLDGQMLIASPSMSDDRFAKSLIYVCAHSPEGAMGIVVNQPANNIKFPESAGAAQRSVRNGSDYGRAA